VTPRWPFPPAGKSPCASRGFTLAEAIVVILVVGIIAAVVAVFVRAPVQGYLDTANRAQLADAADTALRRMVRDLRAALPNSVRTLAPCGTATACLEFIPVSVGGRYRGEKDVVADDPLDFTANDGSFDVLGPAIPIPAGSWLVVYNLGIPGADAYEGGANPTATTQNRRTVTAAASTVNVSFNAVRLPFDSPAKRFHIVAQPVTYQCDLASGQLWRRWDYGFNPVQGSPAGGSSALLADRATGCSFDYSAQAVAQRAGAVLISLQLTNNNETVSLAVQAHVSNVP
jgi:MSHA biogenesis protein MshO